VLQACAAPEPPVRRDLALALARGEVCALADGGCVRGRRATELHEIDGMVGGSSITLPAETSSNIYLRLPRESRVGFEFRAIGAALRLVAEPAAGRPIVLFRSRAGEADDRWHHTEVPTGLDRGTIVRLGFEVRPLVSGRPAMARLQGPVLVGRETPPRRAAPVGGGHPNVVLYVVDTLRADRLGCYGGPRGTSPRLDAFAAGALRFTHAVAQSSWTRPSTASIFTGLVPPRHGALEADDMIDPRVQTLPELLRAAGFATAAFVTNSVAAAPFGFARGFDRFRYFPEATSRDGLFLPADRLVTPIARWLKSISRPFFLYVHATDPHAPYLPPARFRRGVRAVDGVTPAAVIAAERRCQNCLHDLGRQRPAPIDANTVAVLSRLYDGDVARADAAFGRLVDVLVRQRLLDDTLVIFTSDHGEEFLEHDGVTHGKTLYHELLHVPLVIRLPAGARGGTVVEDVAQHADLLPSILELAGVPSPPGLDGEAILGSAGPRPGREIVSHLDHDRRELAAVTDGRWAFIHNLAAPEGFESAYEIYDLQQDSLERRNLAGRDAVLTAYAVERLAEVPAPARPAGPAVDPRELERLRALGYVVP